MNPHRNPASWTAVAATLGAALMAVLLVPAGCSTIPNPACGDEPTTSVCGRLAFDCGTVVLCYACGVARRVNCGTCAATQTCGGGGTPHVCWPPLPDGGEAGAEDAQAEGALDAATVDSASPIDASDDSPSESSDDGAAPDAATSEAGTDGAADGSATSDGGDAAASDAGDASPPDMVLCPDDAAPEDTSDGGP